MNLLVAGYILQYTKSFAANFLVAGAILIPGILLSLDNNLLPMHLM